MTPSLSTWRRLLSFAITTLDKRFLGTDNFALQPLLEVTALPLKGQVCSLRVLLDPDLWLEVKAHITFCQFQLIFQLTDLP